LLREKIVAAASARMLVIGDNSKVVETLGAFALPIEVVPFGLETTRLAILANVQTLALSCTLALRQEADGTPYLTDGGHFIFDASFGRIPDPQALSLVLNQIPGVVENGLFIGLASQAIVAGPKGVEVLERAKPA
ncbi:MAG: ribose-5-phosphate isomerase A, partial [Pseudomonadota bacterium]